MSKPQNQSKSITDSKSNTITSHTQGKQAQGFSINNRINKKSTITICCLPTAKAKDLPLRIRKENKKIILPPITNIEYFGPITKGMDKDTYDVFHPQEVFPYTSEEILNEAYDKSAINIINNSQMYSIPTNPYTKIVNQTIGEKRNPCIGFKSKYVYEKAYEYSLIPKKAKMDDHNPIFLASVNPRDYKHYQ